MKAGLKCGRRFASRMIVRTGFGGATGTGGGGGAPARDAAARPRDREPPDMSGTAPLAVKYRMGVRVRAGRRKGVGCGRHAPFHHGDAIPPYGTILRVHPAPRNRKVRAATRG